MTPFDILWFAALVRLSTPITLAAMGELVAERTGVLNIGLEGMMLVGAFSSFWASWFFSNLWVGIVFGLASGLLMGSVMALVSLRWHADQIVAGVGLNILAFGFTTVGFRAMTADEELIDVGRMQRFEIPLISEIPIVGSPLFNQIPLVYFVYLLVPLVWFVMYRTPLGLKIRAVGEDPATADSAGVSVSRIRWAGTLVAGALAGLAGAFLSIGRIGLFVEGMSGGRGFLAIAAVILGGWHPTGVLGASLFFGGADALQLRLQAEESVPRAVWLALGLSIMVALLYARVALSRSTRLQGKQSLIIKRILAATAILFFVFLFLQEPEWTIPSQLWLALPYVLSLVVLAGLVGRVRAPKALTVPYRGADEG